MFSRFPRYIAAVITAFLCSLVALPSHAGDAPLVVVRKASVSAAAASGVAANVVSTTSVTVPGAKLGDACVASHSVSVAGLVISCAVTATDTAVVSYLQATANGTAVTSGTARVFLIKAGTR